MNSVWLKKTQLMVVKTFPVRQPWRIMIKKAKDDGNH